jgi:hypothetical protein
LSDPYGKNVNIELRTVNESGLKFNQIAAVDLERDVVKERPAGIAFGNTAAVVEIASNATTFSIGMGLVDLAEKLINERGSAPVMEKRLLLIKEEAAVLERKNGEMACDIERFSKENAELKRMLAAATKAEEFVEEFGAAFKRKPDGTLHEAVYCPIHHTPASSMEGEVPYFCSDPNCGWSSNITPNTLKSTILKLNPNSLTRILGL